mgnify:CR=1 FL=1
MIQKFVDIFMDNKDKLRSVFAQKHVKDYMEVVKNVIQLIHDNFEQYEHTHEYYLYPPDPNLIHEINNGSYQGTLVYVIPEECCQPSTHWYIRVNYGSCSGCDTLQRIVDCSGDPPSEKQLDDYMILAMHIVQGLKSMDGDDL